MRHLLPHPRRCRPPCSRLPQHRQLVHRAAQRCPHRPRLLHRPRRQLRPTRHLLGRLLRNPTGLIVPTSSRRSAASWMNRRRPRCQDRASFVLSNPRPFHHRVRVVHAPVAQGEAAVLVVRVDPVVKVGQAYGKCRRMPVEIHHEVQAVVATVADAPGNRSDRAVVRVARNQIRTSRVTGGSRTFVSARCGSIEVGASSAQSAETAPNVRLAAAEPGQKRHLIRAE